jgi:hypothetical protein
MAEPAAANNPIDVFAALITASGRAIPTRPNRELFGESLDFLLRAGALLPGSPLTRITCTACDDDHPVEVEFDPASGRSTCFCPNAGPVEVDNADLETLSVNSAWLADVVTTRLDIAPSPRRRELLRDSAWWLGDVIVGSTTVSFALSVGIAHAGTMSQLAAGLKARKPIDLGIWLTAGPEIPASLLNDTGYHQVDIHQVLRFAGDALAIDHARMAAWVRALSRGTAHPTRGRRGRPTIQGQILTVFEARRQRGIPYRTKYCEANEIIRDWPQRFQDEEPPVSSTIRKHLPAP